MAAVASYNAPMREPFLYVTAALTAEQRSSWHLFLFAQRSSSLKELISQTRHRHKVRIKMIPGLRFKDYHPARDQHTFALGTKERNLEENKTVPDLSKDEQCRIPVIL